MLEWISTLTNASVKILHSIKIIKNLSIEIAFENQQIALKNFVFYNLKILT